MWVSDWSQLCLSLLARCDSGEQFVCLPVVIGFIFSHQGTHSEGKGGGGGGCLFTAQVWAVMLAYAFLLFVWVLIDSCWGSRVSFICFRAVHCWLQSGAREEGWRKNRQRKSWTLFSELSRGKRRWFREEPWGDSKTHSVDKMRKSSKNTIK